MYVIARIDDLGKPAWIVLMVLGFILYWPIGLAILAFILWSGRMWSGPMGCGWQAPGQRRGVAPARDRPGQPRGRALGEEARTLGGAHAAAWR